MSSWIETAELQAGVVALSQLRQVGVTARSARRLLAGGKLVAVSRGVYRLARPPEGPSAWERELWQAVLAAGPEAVAFLRSAARWLGLDGVPADCVEVAVRPPRQCRSASVHRLPSLEARQVAVVRGMPVTTAARTVLDLGSVLDDGRVERALESALRCGMTTLDELEVLAAASVGRGAPLRRVLSHRPRGAQATGSDAETLFVQLVRGAGFPDPARQHQLRLGGRAYRLDFAWSSPRLAVEVDGFATHGSPRALVTDLRRQNRIILNGWLVVRFAWEDIVRYPAAVERDLRHAWAFAPG